MSKLYITAAGDMWDNIAKSQMGNEYYSNQLISANQKYANDVVFDYGVELIIPDVISNESAVNSLPWVT